MQPLVRRRICRSRVRVANKIQWCDYVVWSAEAANRFWSWMWQQREWAYARLENVAMLMNDDRRTSSYDSEMNDDRHTSSNDSERQDRLAAALHTPCWEPSPRGCMVSGWRSRQVWRIDSSMSFWTLSTGFLAAIIQGCWRPTKRVHKSEIWKPENPQFFLEIKKVLWVRCKAAGADKTAEDVIQMNSSFAKRNEASGTVMRWWVDGGLVVFVFAL